MRSPRHGLSGSACALWCVLAGLLSFGPSSAATIYRTAEPFLGITHHQIIQRPNDPNPDFPRLITAQILEIDLDAPGLRFHLTPEAEPPAPAGYVRRSTTRNFVDSVSAQLGINADFYANPGTYAQVIHTGVSEGDIYNRGGHTFNVTQDNQAAIWNSLTQLENNGVTPWTALGGNQRILTNGAVTAPNDSYTNTLNPHTAIGVSEDLARVFLFVVDGRQSDLSQGMRTDEMAVLMRQYGAWNAINVDGGGSTTMVMDDTDDGLQNARVLNSPSDGNERTVANNLVVYAQHNPNYIPLGPIDGATGIPNPVYDELTLIESFETGGLGTFSEGVSNNGSFNLGPQTGVSLDPTVAYHGSHSLRIDYDAGLAPSVASVLRLPSNEFDAAASDPDREVMAAEGYFGFYVKAEPQPGVDTLYVALAAQDGTTTDPTYIESLGKTVPADGQWHLVEWLLRGRRIVWNTGAGADAARGPNFLLDALKFSTTPNSTVTGHTPWEGTLWIDGLAYSPTQSLNGQIIPEPVSSLAGTLAGWWVLRRRRAA